MDKISQQAFSITYAQGTAIRSAVVYATDEKNAKAAFLKCSHASKSVLRVNSLADSQKQKRESSSFRIIP